MKKTLIMILVVCSVGQVISARADGPGLIITQTGAAVSADSTRVEGDRIYYVLRNEKDERVLAAGAVADIVPCLKRGEKYSKDEIAANLELIKALKALHPGLRRKLNAIESDWIIASKPVDPGIAREIEAVLKEFNQNPKAKGYYKRASTALQMIRFRDKTGSHDAVVDKALADMKVAYLGFDLPALLARGDAEKVSKEELKAYREDAIEAIKGKTTEDEKLAIKEAFGKARDTAIRGCIAEIEAFFNKYKAVSVYHKSVEDLRAIKDEICKADSDFALIKESDEKMFSVMKEQYKGYDFSFNKFPVSPKDQSILKVMKPFSSIQPVKGVREECYMIPVRLPYKPMPVAKVTVVPFVLLFNRAQAPALEYCTVLTYKDASGGEVVKRTPMPPPKQVHGRAAMRIAFDFSSAEDGAQGLDDEAGMHVRMRIDARPKSESGGAEAGWIPISNACRIPVSPADEKE